MTPALFALVAAAAPVLNISGDVGELRVRSGAETTVCVAPCTVRLDTTAPLKLEEPGFRTSYPLALEARPSGDLGINLVHSDARVAGRAILSGGSKLLLGGAALMALAVPFLVLADRTAPGNDASAPLVIGATAGGLGLVTFGFGFLSVSVGAPLYLAGKTDIVVRR